MRRRTAACTIAAASVAIACGCEPTRPAATAAAGAPLPGLTDAALQSFAAGRLIFTRTFTPEEGVGPTFNEPRCASCHDLPVTGGAGADPVRKVSRFADGRCDLLREHGGPMLQMQVTAALKELGHGPEAVPQHATAIADLHAPALFGAGLIEAIPDREILAGADPDDVDGNGISGRAGTAADGRVARFGRKAGFADIRSFIENAFLEEMGLTTAGSPREERTGAHALPEGSDLAPDPEINDLMAEQVALYVRLLAPVEPGAAGAPTRDSISEGRRVFEAIGCAACHRPEMTTDAHEIDALSRRRVPLYSDLLLHDMGPENASICAPGAAPAEWRTTPLMGLRLRMSLWHDGRAQSVDAAVRAHGGEGARARERFMLLTDSERANLFRFLESL